MAAIENAPGLLTLAYRAGTHASFKAAMLAALGRQSALAGLTTRKDEDPSIALLDAWAAALDVLTFYQERIANEGFLRTATERLSMLALARAIGYELNPGVAASTHLAFTLLDVEGSPRRVTVAAGTKAQSIPGQDELPQLYETTEPIEAHVDWNTLKPEASRPFVPWIGATEIYVRGTAANLEPGDLLLIVGEERRKDPASDAWQVRRVKEAEVVRPALPSADPDAGYARVTLDRPLGSKDPFRNPEVHVFRQRAALFGHNAPDWRAMSSDIKAAYGGTRGTVEWPRFNIAYERPSTDRAGESAPELDVVFLDALYPTIVPGSWVVLSSSEHQEPYLVLSVAEDAKAEFTLTAKTTRVQLQGEKLFRRFATSLRDTVVFAKSERLDWAEAPLTEPVRGNRIVLDRVIESLPAGRTLIVEGADDVTGEHATEAVTLGRSEPYGGGTRLMLTTALQRAYRRDSVTIHGNVASATHGERRTEIVGSGNGTRAFQKFTLKQKPLTYVPAPTASGSASTLEVRVNKLLWQEVPSLYGRGPNDHVYTTRLADDETVTVVFGDGMTGARLPTGTENITASYRVGTGSDGLVGANQISLLMTRPLGLNTVANPQAPTGAADPDVLADARQNAPRTVLTLERIVSLQDYEDFARSFAGVGKVKVASLWNGERQIVHLTVAGFGGAAVPASSALYQNLRRAIDSARGDTGIVGIDSYRAVTFDLKPSIVVEPRYVADDVLDAVHTALIDAFSFERRALGQRVARSEVLAAIQDVEGVRAVDLDALHVTGTARSLRTVLPARPASWSQGIVVPAELITIRPEGIVLEVMA